MRRRRRAVPGRARRRSRPGCTSRRAAVARISPGCSRARLPRRRRRRLRARRRQVHRRAHGLCDLRDRDRPPRDGHTRAEDRGRDAAPDRGRRQGDRGDRGPQRRARRGRAPLVGSETYFLGEVHGGDFYNRFPTRAASSARVVGRRGAGSPPSTRSSGRCSPGLRTRPVARSTSTCGSCAEAYEIDPEHPLSVALRRATRT